MLVAAAVCPHPPLLVPALAGGAVGELSQLREACATAVGRLLAVEPDLLVICGDAEGTGGVSALARADFAGFGVYVASGEPAALTLPLSLSVGRWLIGAGDPCRLHWHGLARDTPAAEAAELGAQLSGSAPRVAVLAMGDGSARRTERAPGAFDPDASVLDGEVAAALGGADLAAIAGLDASRCDAQLVAGRASWQLLAGAAAASGRRWTGELLADTAPYGVGYLVASWRPQ